MKKLFAPKLETEHDKFIGKHYVVSDLTLIVEDVIAEGGFSYVFLVREAARNKIYALKRMLVNSQTDLENCKQEISIMKQFHRHPAIVPFRGHHTKHTGNGIYEVLLLMSHCPNGTVVDKMNENLSAGFSEQVVVDIFSGVVDAVALMHHHDYCHRDLKVENILIGPNNEYVLCDFGSAMKGKLDPEVDGHTRVEENINKFTTLAYRAPEMCDMYSGYKIGAPADAWALGVLLYKLCFFTTPFEENTLAIARAKYNIPPAGERYSERLLSVIRDTLKPVPADRLTAKEISARLKGDASTKSEAVASTSDHVSGPVSAPAKSLPQPQTDIAQRPVPQQPGSVPQQPVSVPQQPGSVPQQPSAEDCTSIKPRQRPRGQKPPPLERIIVALPAPANVTSRTEHVTSRADPATSPSRAEHATSRTDHATSRAEHATSGGDHGTSEETEPDQNNVKVKRHSVHNTPQLAEDPWGNAGTSGGSSPQSPKTRVPRPAPPPLVTSPLVFLPPPPSSPSHKTRRARGHSRAKSDTTFLKNLGSPAGPFIWEAPRSAAALSSSTGQLSAPRTGSPLSRDSRDSSTEGLAPPGHRHNALSSGSETNFETSGWSNNPFNPPEDEFLKLSLRDKGSSQTTLDDHEAMPSAKSKSSKVSRAQIRSPDPGLSLSNEQLLSLNNRTLSSEALVSPPLDRSQSVDAGVPAGHINHCLSLNSLSSLASLDSTKSPKKKKKLGLFAKKKHKSAEQFEPRTACAIVSNPLHDNFNT